MEDNGPSSDDNQVWHFRGYELDLKDFTNAMLELYKSEQNRSNVWRARLDNTTHWAVIASLVTFIYLFASPSHHYIVLILNTLLVAYFLWIEARRYRYYELWNYRVRLMETDFFAAMLVPPFAPNPEWAEQLAYALLVPEFPITLWEAVGRRFRRNYLWIFLLLGAAAALKGYLHPNPADTWLEFVSRFDLGPISGQVMVLIGLIFNGALFAVGIGTSGMHQSSGEVIPKYGELPFISGLRETLTTADTLKQNPFGRSAKKRAQQLTLIVTAKPGIISDRVLNEMRRGVTALFGKGMFTEQEREILLIAATVTEIPQLEDIVREEDPNAFVIMVPAQEILGRGFSPVVS